MFANYVAAALRNLNRNRLYAAINIVGLAVSFAAALLIALFVRHEFSYDQWIPGHERIHLLTMTTGDRGTARSYANNSPFEVAAPLKSDFAFIERVARIAPANATLRRGAVEGNDRLYWADPDIFDVLPLTAEAGDLTTALRNPNAIVLTRELARKYFGRDDVIGEILELDRKHPLQVSAVIADLPSNSHLRLDAIASGQARFSSLWEADARPAQPASASFGARTYIRLAPGVTRAEVQQALPDFVKRHKPGMAGHLELGLIPMADLHLHGQRGAEFAGLRGSISVIYAVSAIGLLIVTIAGINFINLMTARAARRAVEVGVRKVSGAARRHLIEQFIGETLLYVAFAMAVGLAVAYALLPALNGLLQRDMPFLYWRDPVLAGAAVALTLLLGILAGAYPAFLLSGFRPGAVLKGAAHSSAGSAAMREVLVTLQFAILIGLSLVATVTYRQTLFAVRESLRFDTDQVLLIGGIQRNGLEAPCSTPFREAVRALPGVRATQCSSKSALEFRDPQLAVTRADGTEFSLAVREVDYGFFEFYGLAPLAGRLLSEPFDDAMKKPSTPGAPLPRAVINETAARAYGFVTPGDAVGQVVDGASGYPLRVPGKMVEIAGVVPDFSKTIDRPTPPTIYYAVPQNSDLLSVRLTGRDIPETVEAIDSAWARLGDPIPPPRLFFDQHIEDIYRDITLQSRLLELSASLAILIAALGLLGLSTFMAESRTKEVGIRKSMGAGRADILRLLLWQFARPVLWANVIAWPAAYVASQRWLEGFAYHIDLELWMFLAAAALAVVVALATVAGHAVLLARTEPVTALRYE